MDVKRSFLGNKNMLEDEERSLNKNNLTKNNVVYKNCSLKKYYYKKS